MLSPSVVLAENLARRQADILAGAVENDQMPPHKALEQVVETTVEWVTPLTPSLLGALECGKYDCPCSVEMPNEWEKYCDETEKLGRFISTNNLQQIAEYFVRPNYLIDSIEKQIGVSRLKWNRTEQYSKRAIAAVGELTRIDFSQEQQDELVASVFPVPMAVLSEYERAATIFNKDIVFGELIGDGYGKYEIRDGAIEITPQEEFQGKTAHEIFHLLKRLTSGDRSYYEMGVVGEGVANLVEYLSYYNKEERVAKERELFEKNTSKEDERFWLVTFGSKSTGRNMEISHDLIEAAKTAGVSLQDMFYYFIRTQTTKEFAEKITAGVVDKDQQQHAKELIEKYIGLIR